MLICAPLKSHPQTVIVSKRRWIFAFIGSGLVFSVRWPLIKRRTATRIIKADGRNCGRKCTDLPSLNHTSFTGSRALVDCRLLGEEMTDSGGEEDAKPWFSNLIWTKWVAWLRPVSSFRIYYTDHCEKTQIWKVQCSVFVSCVVSPINPTESFIISQTGAYTETIRLGAVIIDS